MRSVVFPCRDCQWMSLLLPMIRWLGPFRTKRGRPIVDANLQLQRCRPRPEGGKGGSDPLATPLGKQATTISAKELAWDFHNVCIQDAQKKRKKFRLPIEIVPQ